MPLSSSASGTYFYPSVPQGGGSSNLVKLWDGVRTSEVDPLNYLVGIDIAHHKIHESETFVVSDYDSDLDIVEPKTFLIVTPESASVGIVAHFAYQFESDRAVKLEFYEDAQVEISGTLLTPHCVCRTNATAATGTLAFYVSASVNVSGTELEVHQVGNAATGQGASSTTGGGATGNKALEWVLKSDAKYFFKITAIEDDTLMAMNFQYYTQSV